jgi:protein gp37
MLKGRPADHFLLPPIPSANVWLGTSCENQRYADLRIPHLLATPAAVRFLSVEPMLGPVDLSEWLSDEFFCDCHMAPPLYEPHDHRGIDWVICGGESGPGARPMHPDWVRDLRDQCVAAGVPFHFKQWGSHAPWVEYKRSSGYPYVTLEDGTRMAKMPVKAAGRELDGREWQEFPS